MIPYNPYLALACAVVVAVVPFVQGFELVTLSPKELLVIGVLNLSVMEIQRRMSQPGKAKTDALDPDDMTPAQRRRLAMKLRDVMEQTPATPIRPRRSAGQIPGVSD